MYYSVYLQIFKYVISNLVTIAQVLPSLESNSCIFENISHEYISELLK